MALITSFEKKEKKNKLHSTEVTAIYSVFDENGKRYFQIDTYGSSKRENPNKVSQTLQFDKEIARCIVKLLADEFNLTDTK